MMIVESLLLGAISMVLLVDFLLIILWKPKSHKATKETPPMVSVLIAARNEEHTIQRCLDATLQVNYPSDKLEILVGNDGSTDATYTLAHAYAEKYPQIKVLNITETKGLARGKANVLAHLASMAQGDYYFITDADTAVPSTWIHAMLEGFGSNTAIVTGVTGIQHSYLQNTDWLFALGMVKVITDLNQPVTSMGNNMAITKEAYLSVGGYENIPFSITEDFELFKQVRKMGSHVEQLFNTGVLAYSLPASSVHQILNQRKRWMKGAVQLPLSIVALLFFQALYFPGIVTLAIFQWKAALLLMILKIILQSLFILRVKATLRMETNPLKLAFYEVYSFLLSVSSSIFFLLPVKTVWKGRKY